MRLPRPPIHVQRPTIYDGLPPGPLHDAPVEGYLERLLELPVEIFTEICVFLDPQDLRVLSCPAIPNRYGRQLDCGCTNYEKNATEIDYFNKVKTCPTCYKIHYLKYQEATTLYPGLPIHHIRGRPHHRGHERTRFYHRATLQPEFRRYLGNEGGGSGSDSEYEAGLEERCRLINESAKVLKKWVKNEAARQAKELQDRFDKRDESILAKMVALGHDKRHVGLFAAESLGLRFLPYEVTEEEWIAMRPQLEINATQYKIHQSKVSPS